MIDNPHEPVTKEFCEKQHATSIRDWRLLWAAIGSTWAGIGLALVVAWGNVADISGMRSMMIERSLNTTENFTHVNDKLRIVADDMKVIDAKLDDIRDRLPPKP